MDCEVSYEVKHNMDEDYYPVVYCPFCGEQNEEQMIIMMRMMKNESFN